MKSNIERNIRIEVYSKLDSRGIWAMTYSSSSNLTSTALNIAVTV
jgi:hypothetical protein